MFSRHPVSRSNYACKFGSKYQLSFPLLRNLISNKYEKVFSWCMRRIFWFFASIFPLDTTISWVCDLSRWTERQHKWQKNTIGLFCWISHSRGILNGIYIAVSYDVTNRKLTNVSLIYFSDSRTFSFPNIIFFHLVVHVL